MTHFPQPDPVNPAPRVKVGGSVAVTIRSEDGQPVQAQLHDLSATGGLLILSKAFEQDDYVELRIAWSGSSPYWSFKA
jgi:c-di-GMP-binding flagellar brake protein YcgR